MSMLGPFEIAAIVLVVGGLAALLVEIAVRSPRSLLDIIDDVRRFAEPRQPEAEAPPAPEGDAGAAAKGGSDDPRMAA